MPIIYPGTILGSGGIAVNKMDKIPVFVELAIYEGDRQEEINKHIS